MVNLEERLKEIKKLIDKKKYFTINRARQYGKTTTLVALEKYLQKEYAVISLDFQGFSHQDFESERAFTAVFARGLLRNYLNFLSTKRIAFEKITEEKNSSLSDLFDLLSVCCEMSEKPVIMLIDEVDSATNNQVFLDFLSQLRKYYLNREDIATFHSVILAGVYDIKNLKMKIHADGEAKKNSPWNIAADFDVNMSFSSFDISGMLEEYERDYNTGMNISKMADMIYDYTSGYPFLVSRLCKIIDEKVSELFQNKNEAWTKEGVLQAIKMLLHEKNTLFDSLINKMYDYEKIRTLVYAILISGQSRPYNVRNDVIQTASMFGFVKNKDGVVAISNRIFETILYDQFISDEIDENTMYISGLKDKNQFVKNGELDMERILERFVQHFNDIYGSRTEIFKEEEGRKYLLLYLKPIINGVGNYYIEAQTRDMRRTDVIIDYLGKQYIIEMKIWHGEEYNTRGEQQLADYLEYYHLETGYMLSFNFNKNKEVGIKHIHVNGKELIEAVV